MTNSVLEAALLYHEAGLPIILTGPDKDPGIVGKNWGAHDWNELEFKRWLKRVPDAQLGLLLGPLIDVEIDAPPENTEEYIRNAEAELQALAGNVATVSWVSRRGAHHLFEATPDQWAQISAAGGSAVVKTHHLEIRTGAGRQLQSLIPPSTTDGVQRVWINAPESTPIASLPEGLYNRVIEDAVARRKKRNLTPSQIEADRPGDIFCQKATWDDLLVPRGWRPLDEALADVRHWTRPGKSEGVSATTGYCGTDNRENLLYIFSTAPEIEPLEANRTYSLFEAFATLEYGGDFSEASKELARRGYVQEHDGSEFEVLDSQPPTPPAPPTNFDELPDFVFDNPIGEYVLANAPHTEADRDSVYLQAMELFANYVGKAPRFRLNNTLIYANGFLAVVGTTALGRKGTAYNDALELFLETGGVHSLYTKERIRQGVSTGEGLVEFVKDGGTNFDGRMMVYAPEFNRMLSCMRREDNTLSAVLREAYDGGVLAVTTRANPIVAASAHVSVITHTTADEFSRMVLPVDFTNGMLNRYSFLWAADGAVRPSPGRVSELAVTKARTAIEAAKNWVDGAGPLGLDMSWSYAAEEFWSRYYVDTRKPSGNNLQDTLTARAPANIIKHAMRHAILDRSETVELRHLEVAIALWNRFEQSTKRLLAYRSGGSADKQKLLQAILDGNGLSMTQCFAILRDREVDDVRGYVEAMLAEGSIVRGTKKQSGSTTEVYLGVKNGKS